MDGGRSASYLSPRGLSALKTCLPPDQLPPGIAGQRDAAHPLARDRQQQSRAKLYELAGTLDVPIFQSKSAKDIWDGLLLKTLANLDRNSSILSHNFMMVITLCI
jgi:hypothetical protein